MIKKIYLIKGQDKESYPQFSDRILSTGKQVSLLVEAITVKVTYTNSLPPSFSIIPFKKKKIAAFSVFQNNDTLIQELINVNGFVGAYAVDEAIPISYRKSWEDLVLTPGICLFTLFKKKTTISFETFLDRWHNSHTPLSLKIHPLWNYNRNVVTKKLTDNSASWDGIVEEQFKTKDDLLNPIKFFGNPLIMPYRMWQVYSDTKRFLDYRTIEPYYANEVHIKSI